MSKQSGRQYGRERGVGLIEVLVALIVMSLGLLVSVNMQLQSIRTNQDSYYQSQALMLANEMMDRMIGNPEGVADGKYDDEETTAGATAPSCVTGCSAAQLAQLDLFEWSAKLHDLRGESSFIPLLPPSANGTSASGKISKDTAGVYTVTMFWKRMDGDTEVQETLPVKFMP